MDYLGLHYHFTASLGQLPGGVPTKLHKKRSRNSLVPLGSSCERRPDLEMGLSNLCDPEGLQQGGPLPLEPQTPQERNSKREEKGGGES